MRTRCRVGLGLLATAMILGWGGVARGAIKYVTPTGGGLVDGSDWANAFSNLQSAVDACAGGGTIRMRYGTYVVNSQVVISGATDLIVKGGYAGVGETRSDSETLITRNNSVFTRLFNIASSTVTFDALAITGGSLDGAVISGMGLYASSSGLTLTNCIVANNSRERTSTTFRGAGIYVTGGSLTVADSLFTNNYARGWSDSSYVYGGAIYTVGAAVNISGTTFDRNRCNARYLNNQGGAIYMSGGAAAISDCLFTTNSTLKAENYTRDNGRGGAIFASGLSSLDISDSIFIGNLNNELNGRGGILYLEGASQKTRIVRCAMYRNGTRAGGAVTDSGSIYLLSGSLYLTNVLHAANGYGNSLDIAGGTAEAVNCTFAGNVNGFGIKQTAGTFALRNCIVWGNASGTFSFVGGTRGSFNYCFVQDAQDGIANATVNPLFADGVYYHVKSQAGTYAGGWFAGGEWLASEATSPAIDAGDRSLAWADEPQPNFHRVNVGYDANTPVASKSVLGDNPVVSDLELKVFAYAAQNVTKSSALAGGEVASTGGGANPAVTVVWDVSDKGTNSVGAWVHSAPVGTYPPWTIFTYPLEALAGPTCYRLVASNATGMAWSSPPISFTVAAEASVRSDGVTHVTRHTARVHGTLVSNGGVDTVITLHCWPEGDEENVLSFVYNLGQAVAQGNAFAILASGLSSGTDYDFSLDAVNVAGTNSATGTFTTLTTDPIVRYVTPAGAGIADGSSWENAFSNLQAAVEMCLYAGDLICLKSGTYIHLGLDDPNDYSQCFISGVAGLTIRGGYVGSGAPGARSDDPTVLARDVAALPHPDRRILRAANATLTLDSLVVTNGSLNVSGQDGHGLHLVSCNTVVTNCVFIGNGNEISGNNGRTFYGGAVYAQNGTFKAVDTVFTGNRLNHTGDNAIACGGAIYTTAVAATLDRCDFSRNFVCSWYKTHNGGALAFNGGSAVISHCTFTTNHTERQPTDTTLRTNVGLGGAIYANVTQLDMADCIFVGNYGLFHGGAGGAVYLGNTGKKATLTRCAFSGSGLPGNRTFRNHGEITLAGGSLALTNVLVGATANSNAVEILTGTLDACNVTIAGAENGFGIWKAGGTSTLKNAIIWGNSAGGVGGTSGSLSATYTDSQETLPGSGNFVVDPQFADDVYYHLKSRGGHYANGYFEGGLWLRSPVSSPCIDAGDGSPYGEEPKYNGKRINLGAYGNTPAASVTYRPEGAMMILR